MKKSLLLVLLLLFTAALLFACAEKAPKVHPSTYLDLSFFEDSEQEETWSEEKTDSTTEIVLPESNSDSVTCSVCHGDGKCEECGGDQWIWADEWVYINGSPELETVNKLCDGIYCSGGTCSVCGGSGKVSN